MEYHKAVALRTEPRPWQIEQFDPFYEQFRESKMLMLEHEMGLGKTRTSLHMSLTLAKEGLIDRILVIAPKSVCSGWVDQLEIHTGIVGKSVFLWSSSKSTTIKGKRSFEAMLDSTFPIYIVNTEAFQGTNTVFYKWLDKFLSQGKAVVINDEIVKIKDDSSQRTKRCKKFTAKAKYRIGLTGIMAPESPLNVYSQVDFLNPYFWKQKSFFMFKQRYAILKDTYVAEGRVVKTVAGYQNIDELTRLIAPFTWRLQKATCASLPEKIHVPVFLELSKEERDAYDTMKKELMLLLANGEIVTAPSKISLFSRFRQITGGYASTTSEIVGTPTKLRALIDDLEDTNERAIIWCEYRHEVQRVAEALADLGETVIYSGLQDDKANEDAKKKFETGKVRFFVSDTGKGARGLNLQGFCSLEYFYSLTLSTDEFCQAQDRIHRIGQKNTCVYKYLLAKDSVDVRIYDLLTRKESIARAFSDGTLSDVIELLS